MKGLKGTVLSKSGRLAPKHLRKKRGRSAVALLLCVCMALSLCEGWHLLISTAYAATGGPTAGVTRQADPSTMDTYKNMLDFSENTRYAGRLWSDKTVFALGYNDAGNRSGQWNSKDGILSLTKDLDGVDGKVDMNDDFLHVYSVLGSSLELNESVSTPIDLVIILDMSGSMATDVVDGNPHNDGTRDDGLRVQHSRIQQTLDAINQTIDYLMGLNPTNRVAVIGYGATAANLLDLDHYTTTNTKQGADGTRYGVYLSVENFTAYRYEGLTGALANTGSAAYTVHADATGTSGGKVDRRIRNDYGNNNYVKNSPTLIGFHTDMQAGIYQGFNELLSHYNSPQDVTYTYTSTLTGQKKTIPRIPVAFVMTDGGSNYALKAAGTITGNEWNEVPIRTETGSSGWGSTGHNNNYTKYQNEADSHNGSGVILDILLTASYMKSSVLNKYKQLLKASDVSEEDKENPTFSINTISVDTPEANWQKPRVYATMDPNNYFVNGYSNSSWGGRANDIDDAFDLWTQWQTAGANSSITVNINRVDCKMKLHNK